MGSSITMFSPCSEAWIGDSSYSGDVCIAASGNWEALEALGSVLANHSLFAYLSPHSIALPFVSHVGQVQGLSVLVRRCDSRGILL